MIIELWATNHDVTREFNTEKRKAGRYAADYNGAAVGGGWCCPVCLFAENEGDYEGECRNCGWSMGWESP